MKFHVRSDVADTHPVKELMWAWSDDRIWSHPGSGSDGEELCGAWKGTVSLWLSLQMRWGGGNLCVSCQLPSKTSAQCKGISSSSYSCGMGFLHFRGEENEVNKVQWFVQGHTTKTSMADPRLDCVALEAVPLLSRYKLFQSKPCFLEWHVYDSPLLLKW